MPGYFFHLAFELRTSLLESTQEQKTSDQAFKPPRNLNIFSDSLPTSSWISSLAPPRRRKHQIVSKQSSQATTHSDKRNRPDGSLSCSLSSTEQVTSPDVGKVDTKNQSGGVESENGEKKASGDWRLDNIAIESIDMDNDSQGPEVQSERRQVLGTELALKGRYTPSKPRTSEIGYGVIHLYRDFQPSSHLNDDSNSRRADTIEDMTDEHEAYIDKDCTTLCILAVPSYMTPSDMLGWMGHETRDIVSHFRLLRTSRSNRYMVLMKFRDSKDAKKWQKDWNGKLFNTMEPENCHVVFIRSIQFQTQEAYKDPSSFPSMTNDPFIPTLAKNVQSQPKNASNEVSGRSSTALTIKPAPPPTPALIELPTCPVCLERMDETTGLATIFCQHVFHCACLQKWRGSGCPVCRYTQDDILTKSRRGEIDQQHECATCSATVNLWICLICGNIGCGRYDEAHAFAHYKQTSHSFAMDTTTQHIWDYTGDEYVHRLIQNKSDGKLVELPASGGALSEEDHSDDVVPRNKMEDMSLEYTYLLTSQLDSQRIYFEQQVDRAVDKASKASTAAEEASQAAAKAISRLDSLHSTHQTLIDETIPSIQRDRERAERRAEKFETMARKMEKEWREKEVISESLMDRIKHLEKQLDEAAIKNSDLEEQNRDLSFFISGTEKLKGHGEEVQEGTVTVADAPSPTNNGSSSGGKKKRGKGKR